MACEQIIIAGQPVCTLKELLRSGLRAVIIGINPGTKSVAAGHYWQGPHGKAMWKLLTRCGILHDLREGHEDDDAFTQGIGFADLIREPSLTGKFPARKLLDAVPDLRKRLSCVGSDVPIIARYKKIEQVVGDQLRKDRYDVMRLPSPYSKHDAERAELMRTIKRRIGPPIDRT
jgi:TDG/mug DNA glycosylase family protein